MNRIFTILMQSFKSILFTISTFLSSLRNFCFCSYSPKTLLFYHSHLPVIHLELFFTYEAPYSSVQSLSHVQLFATLWTAAHQASLSLTNFQRLFKLMSIKLVMPSNHFILYHPLLLLPSIFLSIRVFSN